MMVYVAVVLLKSSALIGPPAHLILLGSGPEKLPDITGAPKVSDCINPYGLLPSFFILFFQCQGDTTTQTMPNNRIYFMVTSVISICITTPLGLIQSIIH